MVKRKFEMKICSCCGKSFRPKTGNARYCGKECRVEATRMNRIKNELKYVEPKKKKRNPLSITEIQRIGRRYDLNYGETVFALANGEIEV